MDSLFPEKLCGVSSVEQEGSVRFDCLDARTSAVTHITVSSGREADRILNATFCWLAGLAMISLLLLVILKRLLAFGLSAIKKKVSERMGQSGSLETGLYLLDSEEDWYH